MRIFGKDESDGRDKLVNLLHPFDDDAQEKARVLHPAKL